MKLRTRLLRPAFFASEQVTGCSMAARILFQGLWCAADKQGIVEDRPKQLKLLIFPVDRVSIGPLLNELISAGLIVRYREGDEPLLWIPKFVANQNPHPHEAASRFSPPDHVITSPQDSSTNPDVITCNVMSCKEITTKTDLVLRSGSGSEAEAEPKSKGSRLPNDFALDDELKRFASSLGLDPLTTLASFADYWRGVPGDRGRKSDWRATYRNWCRRDAERRGPKKAQTQYQNAADYWNARN